MHSVGVATDLVARAVVVLPLVEGFFEVVAVQRMVVAVIGEVERIDGARVVSAADRGAQPDGQVDARVGTDAVRTGLYVPVDASTGT